MNYRSLLLTALFLWMSALATTAAPYSFTDYVAAEREISHSDDRLSMLADTLESWLAGRLKRNQLTALLQEQGVRPFVFRKVEAPMSETLLSLDKNIRQRISKFAQSESPDAEGQKSLFLSLSDLTERRTSSLLKWRTAKAKAFLARNVSLEAQSYLRWELQWHPIWQEEARLTRQLQLGFLNESASTSTHKREILSSLLRLRVKGSEVDCPPSCQNLSGYSQERLTILARTAEQLIRLEGRKSQGAVTKVRRLSRQLAQLTEKFQAERVELLKSLVSTS